MWAALALTTAALSLAPAQNDKDKALKLSNIRMTYGILGPERKDAKLLPGDVLVVAFDIDNLQVGKDGRIKYAMGMELTRKGEKKAVYKSDPQDLDAVNTLGGTTLPAFALSVIGTDTKKGEYSLKVTVKDRSTNKTTTLTKPFEVLDSDFGLVRVRLTNTGAEPAPPVAVPGQRVMLNCSLVGFKTDKQKLPHVTFEMNVYDAAGKATLAKPFKGDIKTEVKENPDMMTFLPIPLELNRAGKFKVTVKATCNISKKTTEQSIDLNVVGK
jgi:hypothetical protein